MVESLRHKICKLKVAQLYDGRTECRLPAGRSDACGRQQAAEIELKCSTRRLIQAIRRLERSHSSLRELFVPKDCLSKASELSKKYSSKQVTIKSLHDIPC